MKLLCLTFVFVFVSSQPEPRHFVGNFQADTDEIWRWAYPIDQCVEKGAAVVDQFDAIYTCLEDGNLEERLYEDGDDCSTLVDDAVTIYEAGDKNYGELDYFNCIGPDNWVKVLFGVNGCTQTTFNMKGATGVCLSSSRDSEFDFYESTECNINQTTTGYYNDSVCTFNQLDTIQTYECTKFEKKSSVTTIYSQTRECWANGTLVAESEGNDSDDDDDGSDADDGDDDDLGRTHSPIVQVTIALGLALTLVLSVLV